jgi:hypothetical protein
MIVKRKLLSKCWKEGEVTRVRMFAPMVHLGNILLMEHTRKDSRTNQMQKHQHRSLLEGMTISLFSGGFR